MADNKGFPLILSKDETDLLLQILNAVQIPGKVAKTFVSLQTKLEQAVAPSTEAEAKKVA